jgi:CheY-like chemotaxis protein
MDRVVLVVGAEVVRRMTAHAIAGGNYHTLEAESAEEALCVLERQENVSIVIDTVDQVTSADGHFASVVKERWPHISVVIASPTKSDAPPACSAHRPAGRTVH